MVMVEKQYQGYNENSNKCKNFMKIANHALQAEKNELTMVKRRVVFVYPRLQEEQKDNPMRIAEWKKQMVKML